MIIKCLDYDRGGDFICFVITSGGITIDMHQRDGEEGEKEEWKIQEFHLDIEDAKMLGAILSNLPEIKE